MFRRPPSAVLVTLCLLLAGCLAPATTDGPTSTPDPTATPDAPFDLRVENDADREVAVDVWFVAGRLDGVVVTAPDGTNRTYAVEDLQGAPVAVVNATAVTPRGDVDRSIGLRLSGGVDGVTRADVSGVESVVYAVSRAGEEGTDDGTDAGGAMRAGEDEHVAFVGVATCAPGGVVTGLTLAVDASTATTQVTCEE